MFVDGSTFLYLIRYKKMSGFFRISFAELFLSCDIIKKNTPHFLCKVSVDFRIFNFSLTLKCVCIFNERLIVVHTNYRSRLLQV